MEVLLYGLFALYLAVSLCMGYKAVKNTIEELNNDL